MNAKKVTILLVFTIPLIFSVVSRIFFNDFQDGWSAYEKKNYKTARELWLPIAEQGDIRAQFFMGFIHDMGFGVPENDKEAIKWYQLAAEQGDARAQLFLGYLYDFGVGVPENDKEAIKWYQLAANQGSKQAKISIYKLAKKNSPEALKILLNDSRNGSIEAQVNLAEMREAEFQISQDYKKALNQDPVSEEQEYVQVGKLMLNLVSQKDHEDAKKIILDGYRRMNEAKETLGTLYAEGQENQKNQNKKLKWYKAVEYSAKINKYNLAKKNPAQALEDLMDDVDKGIIEAQFILATMYANGEGVIQDKKAAFRLFYLAAKQKGAAQAIWEEGMVANRFVQKNTPQELKLLTNDAEAGIAAGQFKLGIAYALGQVVPKDYEKAVKWYRVAAEQGNSEAQYALGVMYFKGLGVLASENAAMKWFRFHLGDTIIRLGKTNVQEQNNIYSLAKRNVIAALKILIDDAIEGVVTAQYYLGDLYRDGIGVLRNYELAYMWYNLSALQGNKSGLNQISSLEKIMTRHEIQKAQGFVRTWTTRHKGSNSFFELCVLNLGGMHKCAASVSE
jgi:uncharacterized protein